MHQCLLKHMYSITHISYTHHINTKQYLSSSSQHWHVSEVDQPWQKCREHRPTKRSEPGLNYTREDYGHEPPSRKTRRLQLNKEGEYKFFRNHGKLPAGEYLFGEYQPSGQARVPTPVTPQAPTSGRPGASTAGRHNYSGDSRHPRAANSPSMRLKETLGSRDHSNGLSSRLKSKLTSSSSKSANAHPSANAGYRRGRN